MQLVIHGQYFLIHNKYNLMKTNLLWPKNMLYYIIMQRAIDNNSYKYVIFK
jgi:hypothetical protein